MATYSVIGQAASSTQEVQVKVELPELKDLKIPDTVRCPDLDRLIAILEKDRVIHIHVPENQAQVEIMPLMGKIEIEHANSVATAPSITEIRVADTKIIYALLAAVFSVLIALIFMIAVNIYLLYQ